MIPRGEVRVAPSILSADFGNLAEQVGEVAHATDWLHVDVMDGHFVPNVTIGPPVVASLRKHSAAYFDCHLMMTDPGQFFEAFKEAGANSITFHVEIGNTEQLVEQLRELGLGVGLAVNPDTPFEAYSSVLHLVDMVLLMTVFPGFGGQSFISDVVDKIATTHAFIEREGLPVTIEVDGGIGPSQAALTAAAGARIFVAGSAVFGHERPWDAVAEIHAAALDGISGVAV